VIQTIEIDVVNVKFVSKPKLKEITTSTVTFSIKLDQKGQLFSVAIPLD